MNEYDHRCSAPVNSRTIAAVWLYIAAPVAVGLLFHAGIPAFQHDWYWPVDRAQASALITTGFHGWNSSGVGSPTDYPYPWWPDLFVNALNAAFGPKVGLVLFLALVTGVGVGGCAFLSRVLGFGVPGFIVLALGVLGSPVFFDELVAGHIFLIAALALLPWIAAIAFDETVRLRWLIGGVFIGLAAAQHQYLIFGSCVFLAFFRPFSRRGLLTLLGTLAIACVFTSPQWISALGSNLQSLDVDAPLPQWEGIQSAQLTDALRLIGYTAGYDQQLPGFERAALWIIPIGAICGLIRGRWSDHMRFRLGALAAFGLCLAAGFKGPAAQPIQYAFEHFRVMGVFRELYGVAALTALAASSLSAGFAFWLSKRFGSSSPVTLTYLATFAVVSATVLILSPSQLSYYTPGVETGRQLRKLAADHSFYRYATLPIAFPLSVKGGSRGGVSPFVGAYGQHPAALSAAAGSVAFYGLRLLELGQEEQAERILRRAGVGHVFSLPDVVSVFSETLEPSLRGIRTDEASRSRAVNISVRDAVRLAVEPFSAIPGLRDDAYTGARDIRVFVPVSTLSASLQGSSPDPRTSWARTALWPLLPDWVYAQAPGIFTLQRQRALTSPDAYILAGSARGDIRGSNCATVAILGSHWRALHCGSDPVLVGTPPIAVAEIATRVAAIRKQSQEGAFGTVQITESSPSRIAADVVVVHGSALVLRETFNPGWSISVPKVRHVEVDGYANAWIFDRDYSGRVTIEYRPARRKFVALALSVGLLLMFFGAIVYQRLDSRYRLHN